MRSRIHEHSAPHACNVHAQDECSAVRKPQPRPDTRNASLRRAGLTATLDRLTERRWLLSVLVAMPTQSVLARCRRHRWDVSVGVHMGLNAR